VAEWLRRGLQILTISTDQHTLHSKVPVKEFIILQSNLQAISWDTPGTPGNKIFFIYLASGFGVGG
jgi:hypothetical protein